MKKIIFVCTGNTCRSPMIEHILKHKLKLNDINNIKVNSAGIMAQPNTYTSKYTLQALKNMGINAKRKKARQLTIDMVDKDTLLIAITNNHKEYIKNVGKVMSLSDFYSGIDVVDPYGQDISAYEKCAKIFDFITDEIVQLIKKGDLV